MIDIESIHCIDIQSFEEGIRNQGVIHSRANCEGHWLETRDSLTVDGADDDEAVEYQIA
jgi:hypothetical protein